MAKPSKILVHAAFVIGLYLAFSFVMFLGLQVSPVYGNIGLVAIAALVARSTSTSASSGSSRGCVRSPPSAMTSAGLGGLGFNSGLRRLSASAPARSRGMLSTARRPSAIRPSASATQASSRDCGFQPCHAGRQDARTPSVRAGNLSRSAATTTGARAASAADPRRPRAARGPPGRCPMRRREGHHPGCCRLSRHSARKASQGTACRLRGPGVLSQRRTVVGVTWIRSANSATEQPHCSRKSPTISPVGTNPAASFAKSLRVGRWPAAARIGGRYVSVFLTGRDEVAESVDVGAPAGIAFESAGPGAFRGLESTACDDAAPFVASGFETAGRHRVA